MEQDQWAEARTDVAWDHADRVMDADGSVREPDRVMPQALDVAVVWDEVVDLELVRDEAWAGALAWVLDEALARVLAAATHRARLHNPQDRAGTLDRVVDNRPQEVI